LMMKSKWDINNIESKAVRFGTGSHITAPAAWTGKTVIAMLKTKWDERSRKKGDESE
jgi:phosphate starvation-inducible protein PhoH